MSEALALRITAEKARAERLTAALQAAIDKLKLPAAPVVPPYDSGKFALEIDPYSQQATLVCRFYATPHYRCGQLLFHADGLCFGEFDIGHPHPYLQGMFVEAVEGWGQGDVIKAEMRLLEMPA